MNKSKKMLLQILMGLGFMLLICYLLFLTSSSAQENTFETIETSYEQGFMEFLEQQKSQLGIAKDLQYKSILQKFMPHHQYNWWPSYVVIEFQNHINEDGYYAYYHMTCSYRTSGLSCRKQNIAKLKYKNQWVDNYLNLEIPKTQIIDIIQFADLNQPDERLLPVLSINSEGHLFTVCFGNSNSEPKSEEQYIFPRYCLPIKRTKMNQKIQYEALYDSIEYSELIVD